MPADRRGRHGVGAWFRDRDVAAVATDNITSRCSRASATTSLPVHLLRPRRDGLTQGQNWDLEELAADCADDGVRVPAVAVPAAVRARAGPVNPVAVK